MKAPRPLWFTGFVRDVFDLFVAWTALHILGLYLATQGRTQWATLVDVDRRHSVLGLDLPSTLLIGVAIVLARSWSAPRDQRAQLVRRGIVAILAALVLGLAMIHVPPELLAGALPGNLFYAGVCLCCETQSVFAALAMLALLLARAVAWVVLHRPRVPTGSGG